MTLSPCWQAPRPGYRLPRHASSFASVSLVIVLTVVVGAPSAALAASGADQFRQAASAQQDCRQRVRLPRSARYGRLTDLFRAGRQSWALGATSSSYQPRAIALRKGAGPWRSTFVPLTGISGLMGGDAGRAGVAWAVGFTRPGVSMRPIAMRFRAGRWVNVRVPDPPGPGATLTAAEVLPSGRVWAVGARLRGGARIPTRSIGRAAGGVTIRPSGRVRAGSPR